jgi:DNA-binding MarR family transcriptional regulator
MNNELGQLKNRIAELERQNQELRREVAALKGQPQREILRSSGDKGRDILQYFLDNPQNLTATQVASRLKLTQSVAQYHLDRLVLLGHLTTAQNLTEVQSTGNRVGYLITPQGRAAITGAT